MGEELRGKAESQERLRNCHSEWSEESPPNNEGILHSSLRSSLLLTSSPNNDYYEGDSSLRFAPFGMTGWSEGILRSTTFRYY